MSYELLNKQFISPKMVTYQFHETKLIEKLIKKIPTELESLIYLEWS